MAKKVMPRFILLPASAVIATLSFQATFLCSFFCERLHLGNYPISYREGLVPKVTLPEM